MFRLVGGCIPPLIRHCTLVRYAFFVMVQVRYIGTLFEFAYKTFYVLLAAVNKHLGDRARRAHSLATLGYSQVINIALSEQVNAKR